MFQVLVAEENPGDARLLAEAFAECGSHCELIGVGSHAEAGQRLSAESFDFLLTYFGKDYQEAEQFLRSVRTAAPCMPIIVLSAMPDPNPAYAAGANAFIRKTSDLQEFLDKIRSLLHFWTEVAELPERRPRVGRP